MSPQLLAHYGFQVGNTADAILLRSQIGNLSAAQQAALAARGVGLPYAGFPTNQTVLQSLLAFPQYTTIAAAGDPLGKTWYDALQLVVTKRFSHGLALNANYAYSKSLSLMSSVDPFNPQLGKDRSATDPPHQFQLSANYTVPTLRNGLLGRKFVSPILSGWSTGWYLQYQSGPLLTLPASTGANPISNWLGYGRGPAQLKPGMSPFAVNWKDKSGTIQAEPVDINCGCFDAQKTLVLNPNAWTNVPDGQFANNMYSIGYYRGFRYPNENLNVSREFRIRERVRLVVRAEWQNILNRLRLPQPTTTGFQANPTQANGVYTGGFGTVNPVAGNGVSGMRSGTLIGRLTF